MQERKQIIKKPGLIAMAVPKAALTKAQRKSLFLVKIK